MSGTPLNPARLFYVVTVPNHLREMALDALEAAKLPALAAQLRHANGGSTFEEILSNGNDRLHDLDQDRAGAQAR